MWAHRSQASSGESLGIRAENFEIVANARRTGLSVGVVDLVEKLGDLTVTYVRSPSSEDSQVVTVKTVGDVLRSALGISSGCDPRARS